jgi:apolipoprotein N-acyltransferase
MPNYLHLSDARKSGLALSLISGAMLGAAFPPSPFYLIAYVAFVPFFFLWLRLENLGIYVRYLYVQLFAFHLVCVYWTGGWAVGKDGWLMLSNLALLFLHPFLFVPFLIPAHFVRKRLGFIWGIAAFSLLWVSVEYWNAYGDLSFPWMTIGNSQSFDLARIQVAEFTSAFGLSFLILACNGLTFLLILKLGKEWKLKSTKSSIAFSLLVVLFFGPLIYGNAYLAHRARPREKIVLALIQPNFDPWEKWGEGSESKSQSYEMQFNAFISTSHELADRKPDLIIWPETAIPFYVFQPKFARELARMRALVDSIGIPILAGMPYAEYLDASKASATAHRFEGSNIAVESYNSATLFVPRQTTNSIYKKIVLVPFGERLPYAETLKFLIEPLKWNVGISSWGRGKDTLIFGFKPNKTDSVKFGGMICYESVYPDYVREFVRKGAQFLVIITNDSWWGRTSGAYQHAAFASLRAVETRRWVVQCANGGISMFVDQFGIQHQRSELYTAQTLLGAVELGDGETFYVKHGDLFAQGCVLGGVVLVLYAFVKRRV